MSTSIPTNSTAHLSAHAQARALSPALAALSLGSGAGASAAESTAASDFIRRQAYEKANTVTELIATIPANYREALGTELRFISDLTEKLVTARSIHRKIESAIADGQIPSHLLLKVPELQACKEFRESGKLQTVNQAVSKSIAAAQSAVMETALAGKQAEVEHLEGLLARDSVIKRMSDLVLSRWGSIRDRSQIPTFTTSASVIPSLHVTGNITDIKVDSWVTNPTVVAECNHLIEDLWPIAIRCMFIIELRDAALKQKIDKKKAVEKSADVEMADATKPGPSIQSLVDKAVAGRVKPLVTQVQKLSVKSGKTATKKPVAKKATSSAAPPKKPSAGGPKKTVSKTTKPSGKGGKGKGKAGTQLITCS
ncbi:hypothetical protein C2E23DRAFT_907975 [Lenzites betulinus]|nr:hypothetical protein C2E23DRAFT_907975 [Lenzites betulinus]